MTITGTVASTAEPFLPRGRIARVVQIDKDGVVRIALERLSHQHRRANFVDPIALRTKKKLKSIENMFLIVRR